MFSSSSSFLKKTSKTLIHLEFLACSLRKDQFCLFAIGQPGIPTLLQVLTFSPLILDAVFLGYKTLVCIWISYWIFHFVPLIC